MTCPTDFRFENVASFGKIFGFVIILQREAVIY